MSTQDTTLPPLPEPDHRGPTGTGSYFDSYSADQMRAYARAAIAAQAPQPACKTCNDNGMIGGPSFYAPDEGGVPCPDCTEPVQQAQGVPAGMVLVPLRMTQAMRDVTGTEDWQWEDLLAAAGAITEEEYNQLAASPQAEPVHKQSSDIRAVFEAWVEGYPIQIVEDDYEMCFDAFQAGYAVKAEPQQAEPLTDAQFERLYSNIPPSAQQDARSREAFKRLGRLFEAAHGIGTKGGEDA